jgi:hypothetical protein
MPKKHPDEPKHTPFERKQRSEIRDWYVLEWSSGEVEACPRCRTLSMRPTVLCATVNGSPSYVTTEYLVCENCGLILAHKELQ